MRPEQRVAIIRGGEWNATQAIPRTLDVLKSLGMTATVLCWDKDGDGEYPPYDKDDLAVLDGNVEVKIPIRSQRRAPRRARPRTRPARPTKAEHMAMAIRSHRKRSHMEIAHLVIRDYGSEAYNECGAMKLFNSGKVLQHHVYVHDVEMKNINKGVLAGTGRIVMSWWGGPREHVALINCEISDFGAYGFRGSPQSHGNWRFQNLTMTWHPKGGDGANVFGTGFKLWGTHNGVEIIDNVFDAQPTKWNAVFRETALMICYCAQDYTIRNNEFIDHRAAIALAGDTGNFCRSRPVDNIVIDRNIIRNTYRWGKDQVIGISLSGGKRGSKPLTTATVEAVTITNNFILSSAGGQSAIWLNVGNDAGPQKGAVTIAGNTFYGPWVNEWFGKTAAITILDSYTHKQQSWAIKNNIFANSGRGHRNIAIRFAPTNLVMNGNVYDPNSGFDWEGRKTDTLAEWQGACGQDADSVTGAPLFVNSAKGDLHLDPNDTVAKGTGVDITKTTKADFDGDPRSSAHPVAGADVPGPKTTKRPLRAATKKD